MIKRLLEDEKVVSFTGTILLHGLIVLGLMLIHINFRPVVEEFTEVTFAGGWEAPSLEEPLQTPDAPMKEETAIDESAPKLPEEIELPERRQLALNEEEIQEKLQPETEKFSNPGDVVKKSLTTMPPLAKSQNPVTTFSRQEKQMDKGLFHKQLDDKLLQGTQKVQINPDRQFEIDWEGEIKREIYQQRLPEFPPDVQREATIKIRFAVLPNGLIGSAVLLQKGDTKLENLTLEAFKTWRFNPLPDYVEQTSQTGVITFHFKLK